MTMLFYMTEKSLSELIKRNMFVLNVLIMRDIIFASFFGIKHSAALVIQLKSL